jgi:hypothetical protein
VENVSQSPGSPRSGRGNRLFDVTLVQVPRLEDRVGPHTRVAVRLQLEPHRELVAVARVLALEPADLIRGAELVLHVVAHLVRDHVGPRELARRAELLSQVVIEREVDVDPVVARAVERPDR